jgi:hypothetical protein
VKWLECWASPSFLHIQSYAGTCSLLSMSVWMQLLLTSHRFLVSAVTHFYPLLLAAEFGCIFHVSFVIVYIWKKSVVPALRYPYLLGARL